MVSARRRIFAGLCCALLVASASPALAEPPPPTPSLGAKVLDALIVRPASMTQAILGSWVLIIAYPLSLASGQSQTVLEVALLDPLDYAVRRPLGEF